MRKFYPKLDYFCVCDDIRHEVGEKVSYMGVYPNDVITIPIPHVLLKLCFHLSFSKLCNGDKFKMKVLDPNKNIVASGESPVYRKSGKRKYGDATLNVSFMGLQITEEGTHEVILAFGKDKKAQQNFKIVFEKEEEEEEE